MTDGSGRPVTVKALVVLGLLSGVVGILSGYALIADPSGEGLGLSTGLLDGLPVGDFSLVGLLLSTAFGVVPLVAAAGLLTMRGPAVLRSLSAWSRHHWAWTGTVAVAVTELIWMTVEAFLIGLFGITVFWSFFQLAVLVVARHPDVRRFYALARER